MIVYFDVDAHDLHKTFFSLQLFLKNKNKIFLKHIKHVIQKKYTTFVFFVYTEKNDFYIAKNESIFDVLNKNETFFLIRWKRLDHDKCVDCCRSFKFRISSFLWIQKNIDRNNHENKVNRFRNVVVFIEFKCELLFDFVSNALSNFVLLIILNY